ncbi:probable inactive receptor kinase rlk902 [Phtheirospermum japonicum]|uniref:Probable inactive receptor kinase rlk902 n=1 Tax=Phtheirospermum japonicum TaxID=374723 RepID=A0A830BNH7_9LAMI|nr:probable inactive receptor kinase rlk902 [Phtheirospermum japonicum]
MINFSLYRLSLLLLSLTSLPPAFSLLAGDLSALLRLRAAVRGRTLLWNTTAGAAPCSWDGVTCDDTANRVVELRLPGDGLSGQLPANIIGGLTELRALSLRENSLSGEIPPDIASCTQLQDLHLQGNAFSGVIPASFFTLGNLVRVNLAGNSFAGNLSPGFNSLTNLTTLYLENNRFTGSLPDLHSLDGLMNFNASFNGLIGSIPSTLGRFPAQSFLGNSLCGRPLATCQNNNRNNRLSNGAIAGIAIGSSILLILILIVLFISWRTHRSRKILPRPDRSPLEREIWSPNPNSVAVENNNSSDKSFSSEIRKKERFRKVGSDGLVFFGENVEVFSLQELLSSSAEVLGQGTVGSTYKAYFDSGVEVIVKRLRNVCVSEGEFRDKIEEVGLLVHENLEGVKGYFYGRDERLLLYEPMANGSLSALLHGNDNRALSFENRAKIALGIAAGIEYLHSVSPITAHGNIKSSNVFLTDYHSPRVSEFGLTQLVSSVTNLNGYRAPEVADTRTTTHEADVYSFGALLLELFTRKQPDRVVAEEGMQLPGWVQSVDQENWTTQVFDPELLRYENVEDKMVRFLKIAVSCVDREPDRRPPMAEVTLQIKEICG